jgi:hypothetical protein
MNNRGSILTTAVVFVLILTTISILVMGLVISGVEMQHRNEMEIKAHLNLENAGYVCLNQYATLNKTLDVAYDVPQNAGYIYMFTNLVTVGDNTTGSLTVNDSAGYQLVISFTITKDSNLYQIQGWVISNNG